MSDSLQYSFPPPITDIVVQRSDARSNPPSSSGSDYAGSVEWCTVQPSNGCTSVQLQNPTPYDDPMMASTSITAPSFPSFAAPFFSPVGTLDSIPLTPWSGQPQMTLQYDMSLPPSASDSLTSSVSSYFPLPTPTYPSPRSLRSSYAFIGAGSSYPPTSATGTKHVFHPSPPSAGYGMDIHHRPISEQVSGGWMTSAPFAGEAKPPRFRPSKEQLDILIAAYEENKTPDAEARQALARKLGPGIRTKTLQIWFQNRRSKARAREREASLPRDVPDGRDRSLRPVDMDALRILVHDSDPSLTLIPLNVLCISSWTRFLTPGSVLSPDLGASLSTVDSPPRLSFYVVHRKETFRLSLSVDTSSMSNLGWTDGTGDAVAVTLDLASQVAQFAAWKADPLTGTEGWKTIGDSSGGEAGRGGRCEMTGTREVLRPVYDLLRRALSTSRHSTPGLSGWRFPLTASPASMAMAHNQAGSAEHTLISRFGHVRNRSASAPQLSVDVPPLVNMPAVAVTAADILSPASVWSASTAAETPFPAITSTDNFAMGATPVSAAVHSPTHRQPSSGFHSFSALGLTGFSTLTEQYGGEGSGAAQIPLYANTEDIAFS